jgi:hypothetical protein
MARLPTIEIALGDGGASADISTGSDSQLRLIVVRTTREGTVAALRAAGTLCRNLGARFELLAPEVVPIHFSLHRPHVPVWFLERRLHEWVREAGIADQDFSIQACLCRSRKLALIDALAPHSLIVVGADTRWWNPRDRMLVRWLRHDGHQVIVVPADPRKRPDPKQDRGRLATYIRALEFERAREISN